MCRFKNISLEEIFILDKIICVLKEASKGFLCDFSFQKDELEAVLSLVNKCDKLDYKKINKEKGIISLYTKSLKDLIADRYLYTYLFKNEEYDIAKISIAISKLIYENINSEFINLIISDFYDNNLVIYKYYSCCFDNFKEEKNWFEFLIEIISWNLGSFLKKDKTDIIDFIRKFNDPLFFDGNIDKASLFTEKLENILNTEVKIIDTFYLKNRTLVYKNKSFICSRGGKLSFIQELSQIKPFERILKEKVERTVFGDKGQGAKLKNLIGKINMDFKKEFGIETAFSIEDVFIRRNC